MIQLNIQDVLNTHHYEQLIEKIQNVNVKYQFSCYNSRCFYIVVQNPYFTKEQKIHLIQLLIQYKCPIDFDCFMLFLYQHISLDYIQLLTPHFTFDDEHNNPTQYTTDLRYVEYFLQFVSFKLSSFQDISKLSITQIYEYITYVLHEYQVPWQNIKIFIECIIHEYQDYQYLEDHEKDTIQKLFIFLSNKYPEINTELNCLTYIAEIYKMNQTEINQEILFPSIVSAIYFHQTVKLQYIFDTYHNIKFNIVQSVGIMSIIKETSYDYGLFLRNILNLLTLTTEQFETYFINYINMNDFYVANILKEYINLAECQSLDIDNIGCQILTCSGQFYDLFWDIVQLGYKPLNSMVNFCVQKMMSNNNFDYYMYLQVVCDQYEDIYLYIENQIMKQLQLGIDWPDPKEIKYYKQLLRPLQKKRQEKLGMIDILYDDVNSIICQY